jgi:hypothetical protein
VLGGKICFGVLTDLLNISGLLHTKFAAVTLPAEGKVLFAVEKWVKFPVHQEDTLRLILSVRDGRDLVP